MRFFGIDVGNYFLTLFKLITCKKLQFLLFQLATCPHHMSDVRFFLSLVRLLFIDRQMKSEAIVLASLFPLIFVVILLYLLIYSQPYIQILLAVSNNIDVKNVIKFVKQLRITNPSNFRFIFFLCIMLLSYQFCQETSFKNFFSQK